MKFLINIVEIISSSIINTIIEKVIEEGIAQLPNWADILIWCQGIII